MFIFPIKISNNLSTKICNIWTSPARVNSISDWKEMHSFEYFGFSPADKLALKIILKSNFYKMY